MSAFPGVGKTTYHKNNPVTTLDSDSSGFSWVINENGETTELNAQVLGDVIVGDTNEINVTDVEVVTPETV